MPDAVEDIRVEVENALVVERNRLGRMPEPRDIGNVVLAYASNHAVDGAELDSFQSAMADQTKATRDGYGMALAYASERLWNAVMTSSPPPIEVTRKKVEGVLTTSTLNEKKTDVRGQVQRLIEEIGDNGKAAARARNTVALEEPLVALLGGEFALQGPWLDVTEGIVRDDHQEWLVDTFAAKQPISRKMMASRFQDGPTEFFVQTANRFYVDRAYEVGKQWTLMQNQIAVYLAMLQGVFL